MRFFGGGRFFGGLLVFERGGTRCRLEGGSMRSSAKSITTRPSRTRRSARAWRTLGWVAGLSFFVDGSPCFSLSFWRASALSRCHPPRPPPHLGPRPLVSPIGPSRRDHYSAQLSAGHLSGQQRIRIPWSWSKSNSTERAHLSGTQPWTWAEVDRCVREARSFTASRWTSDLVIPGLYLSHENRYLIARPDLRSCGKAGLSPQDVAEPALRASR